MSLDEQTQTPEDSDDSTIKFYSSKLDAEVIKRCERVAAGIILSDAVGQVERERTRKRNLVYQLGKAYDEMSCG